MCCIEHVLQYLMRVLSLNISRVTLGEMQMQMKTYILHLAYDMLPWASAAMICNDAMLHWTVYVNGRIRMYLYYS